jgi:hypothetical protein
MMEIHFFIFDNYSYNLPLYSQQQENMKCTLLLFILLVVHLSHINCEKVVITKWLVTAGSTGGDIGYAITTGENGDLFVTGVVKVSKPMKIGSIEVTGFSKGDIFLARLTTTGNVKWAVVAGGANDDYGMAIAVSNITNDVFITGSISGSTSEDITFQSFNSTSSKIQGVSATKSNNVFVAKYGADGTFKWAKSGSGTQNDAGLAITATSDGGAIACGRFTALKSATIKFGSKEYTPPQNGLTEIFVVKYDASGDVKWLKTAGGTGFDACNAIVSTDDGGFCIAGGVTESSASKDIFGLVGIQDKDAFVAKYNSSGTLEWAISGGGSGVDTASSITTAIDGGFFVTGYVQSNGPIIFGAKQLALNTSSASNSDIFVVKYDKHGNTEWIKLFGSSSLDQGLGISATSDGGAMVTGFITVSVFRKVSFGSVDVYGVGYSDGNSQIFVAKIDSQGDIVWAQSAGGVQLDIGYGITTNNNGSVFVTGHIYGDESTIDFNSIEVFVAGNTDVFIAEYSEVDIFYCSGIKSISSSVCSGRGECRDNELW